ncbi:hypothetical protein ACFWYW_20485 [Nonomuraea sp. NPDC059023]|uniref:hypothetical protein n=1 Tax=Nonomuraea sp. NPDC059023 TaxID=3346706 RepID=UPI003694AF8A
MKRFRQRLQALWERLLWQAVDDSAQSAGLQVRVAKWHKRIYRDPRFDQVPAERPALSIGEPARHSFGPGDGHPRNHPRIPVSRDWPATLGRIWRWRIELGSVAVGAAVLGQVAWWWSASAMAVCVAVPYVRRRVAGGLRALMVRHRFQGLCLRTSLRSPGGRLPLVIRTAHSGRGVAMVVWCRSGMSQALFESYHDEIKVACFATGVAISTYGRWSHLVLLEIRG